MKYVIFVNEEERYIVSTIKVAQDILSAIPVIYNLEIKHTYSGLDGSVQLCFAPNQHGINSAEMCLCKLYPPKDTREGAEFEFYSVQYISDYECYALTAACFRTKAEAERWLKKRKEWYLNNDPESWNDKEWAIVGQRFSEDYAQYDFLK